MGYFVARVLRQAAAGFASFILVLSSVSVAVPVFLSQNAGAVSYSVCGPVACDADTIQATIDLAGSGETITFAGNASIAHQLTINKALTIEGSGYSISPTFAKTDNSNNASIGIIGAAGVSISHLTIEGSAGTTLHGINAFESTATLNNVSLKNNDRDGLVANASRVTVNNINTSGNGWGGIDVDKGTVASPALLTINGLSTHQEATQVRIDDTTKTSSVTDANNQYNVVNYGNVRVFTLKPAPLAAPINLLPANNSFTNNPSFNNTWNAVAGAVKYEYKTTYLLNGAAQTYQDTSDAGNYDLTGATVVRKNNGAPESTYSWQVRAIDAAGSPGVWSSISNVTVDSTIPTTPTDGLPNATYQTTNNFYFTWSDSADAGSPVNYEFQSSGSNAVDSNGSLVGAWNSIASGNAEQNNLTTPTIHSIGAGDGGYYWQVRAFDAAGNKSAWSTVWNMMIDSTNPAVPLNLKVTTPTATLASPAMTSSNSVTTSWDAVPGAVSYVYKYWNGIVGNQYKENSAYEVPVNGTSVSGAFTEGEGTHYIAVKAVDAAGNMSDWTAPFIVTYDKTAPNAPENLTVTAGAVVLANPARTNSESITTSWGAVSDAVKYEYAVFNDIDNTTYTKVLTDTSLYGVFNLGEGTHTIKVRAIDASGNVSPWTDPFIVTFDTTAPKATINTIATDTAIPTITGTLDELAAGDFTVKLDGVKLNVIQTGTDWSAATGTPQADGLHTLRVEGRDLAGNPFTVVKAFTTVLPVVATPVIVPTVPATTTAPAVSIAAPQSLPQNQAAFGTTPIVDTEAAVLGANTSADATADVAGIQTSKNVAAAAADVDGKGFFGLAWYWWLAILAAVASAWWFIAAMRRRNDQNA